MSTSVDIATLKKLITENIKSSVKLYFHPIFYVVYSIRNISSVINRGLDILFSLTGLVLLIFLFPLIALLIKLDSKGPVFYKSDRVGLNGKIFKMYKFRTMYYMPDTREPGIPFWGDYWEDPRITPVGVVLRRLKLNEFPQFINVFKGDMSLIGPRPEAPELVAGYPEVARKLFSVKPGVAGPNQILRPFEEESFPPGVDPVKFYLEHLLPKKLPLDLEYIEDPSIFKNFKYLFLAVKVTVSGFIGQCHLVDNRTQIFMFLCDAAFCVLSFTCANYLRYDNFALRDAVSFPQLLLCALLIRLPIFIYFGFYHTLIGNLSIYEIRLVFKGVTLSSLALICFSFLSGLAPAAEYSRDLFAIDWFCLTFLLIGHRILLAKLYQRQEQRNGIQVLIKRVLIWGVGDGGELCMRYLQKNRRIKVVGFIDYAPKHRRINGVRILGNWHHLKILSKLYQIQEVYVAMPSVTAEELRRGLEICHDLDLEVKLFNWSFSGYQETKVYPDADKRALQPFKNQ